MKDVGIRSQVKTHSSWKMLTESFRSVKRVVSLQVMLCPLSRIVEYEMAFFSEGDSRNADCCCVPGRTSS